MIYKAIRTLKPHKVAKKGLGYTFKHWWIIKGQIFRTKEINGHIFIVGLFGNLICRVNSAYQQDYFIKCCTVHA